MSESEKAKTEKDAPVPEVVEPVILFVNYQASEVNNASWLVYREETGGKLVFAAYCAAFSFTVLLSLSYLGIFNKSPLPEGPYKTWIVLTLFLAVIFIPPIFACWLWQFLKATRLETFSRDFRYRSPTTYTITPDGFQFSLDSTMLFTPWNKLTACYELAESLTLVCSGAIFPLPKRCFASNQQLKNIRKLIIEKGVAYSTIGPQKAEIVFSGGPGPIEIHFESQKPTEKSESAAVELDGAPNEPDSERLTEPITDAAVSQSLTIECNYSLQELKEVDKQLFFKYDMAELGFRYISYMIFTYVYCKLMILIMGELGDLFSTTILKCAPLTIPVFLLHARYLFEKRVNEMREMVKQDPPIFITLSSEEFSMRSRRASFTYPWTRFYNCIVTKEHYICRGLQITAIIPKRALDSSSKEIFVENLLRTKIKKYEEWS